MDNKELLIPLSPGDTMIQIPEQLLDAEYDKLDYGVTLLSCSDWCAEVCTSSYELCREDPCNCSNQGKQCLCSNQGGQCTCSNQGGQCTCNNQGGQCTCSNQGGQEPVKTRSSVSPPDTTSTSAKFTVTLNDAATIRLFVRMGEAEGTGDTVYDSDNRSPGGNTWGTTVTGLSPSTTYAYNLWDDIGGWLFPTGKAATFETKPNPRPKYWSWTKGLVSSRPAVGVLSSGDDIPSYISASGWTSFVQNIKDVYNYRMGASYSGSLSNGGNGTKVLSAAMVNQAITAIGTMTSTYLPRKTTSNITKLSASLLNGLADSLNSIT